MSWVVYPFLMISVPALYLVLLAMGVDLLVSTYAPILLAAAAACLLERVMPYRRAWHPQSGEAQTDLIYMVVVQLALPRLLALTAGLGLLNALDHWQVAFDLWPGDRPVLMQAGLLILCVSFIRYWTHRAAHEWQFLWRLHAVHHSPDKLYWLNLGRFHPLEETIRFATESLPFMLLGVPGEVLALYFVLLSVNGFLFHSNIRLKHGILNQVFATAELHRWHHAIDPRTAACNYGNLLIVWDTLFGTRYLPPSAEVGTLGLNRPMPRHFAGQLMAPFAAGPGPKNVSPGPAASRGGRRGSPS